MNIIDTIRQHASTHTNYLYIIIVILISYGIGFKYNATSAIGTILKYLSLIACIMWLYFRIMA